MERTKDGNKSVSIGENMRNPFIVLTSLRGNRVRVNINHIITYSPRKFSDTNKYYTYMTNASPALLDTDFRETVEEIDAMIEEYYNYFQR